MSEFLNLKNSQLRYSELELRRHLIERGCPKQDIKYLLEKYTGIQLGAEPLLWEDLPVNSLHRPYTETALISPDQIPVDTLEQLTGLSGISRTEGVLNRGHHVIKHFPKAKDRPNARSNSFYDLRQNVVDWQKPEVQKMHGFIHDNPNSLFVLNTYSRAHIARGAVMLPAVNHCLGCIFRNSLGNISAVHMHKSEQPSMADISQLLEESSRFFGAENIPGGHLTLVGMEFPWELLQDRPEPKIPLLYRSAQVNELCNLQGITATRIPVGLDQKETRVWQVYATTNQSDPVIGSVDITRQEGYTRVPKGYSELMSELSTAYALEP